MDLITRNGAYIRNPPLPLPVSIVTFGFKGAEKLAGKG